MSKIVKPPSPPKTQTQTGTGKKKQDKLVQLLEHVLVYKKQTPG